jgi:hypothetical protein
MKILIKRHLLIFLMFKESTLFEAGQRLSFRVSTGTATTVLVILIDGDLPQNSTVPTTHVHCANVIIGGYRVYQPYIYVGLRRATAHQQVLRFHWQTPPITQ